MKFNKRQSFYITDDFMSVFNQFLELVKTDSNIPKDVQHDLKKPSQRVSYVLRRLIKFYVTNRAKQLTDKGGERDGSSV